MTDTPDKPDLLEKLHQYGRNWLGEDRGPEQVVESFVGQFPLLSDLYFGFGGDHLFEFAANPVGFVENIINKFLADPVTALSNPFLLVLSPDDFASIGYSVFSPFIVPSALAIAPIGAVGGFAEIAARRLFPGERPKITAILHPSPASFTRAAARGAGYLHGIVIQFPFYAGMYGLIRYSGLAEIIGRWFVSIASPRTFPVIIYWYSGILSYFIPSGGSKWAVEAPYVLSAAKTLGVAAPHAILAYAWGDMSTHFLQPFWAIPLLAIARVEFKDIVGYLAILFVVNFVLVSTAFMLLPYLT